MASVAGLTGRERRSSGECCRVDRQGEAAVLRAGAVASVAGLAVACSGVQYVYSGVQRRGLGCSGVHLLPSVCISTPLLPLPLVENRGFLMMEDSMISGSIELTANGFGRNWTI